MTPIPIGDAKRALRREVRERLKALTPERRAEASAKARALLTQQARWKTAHAILFFAPMPEELDVWPLFVQAVVAGKAVALPRYDPVTQSYITCRVQNAAEDVETGQFGIREPKLRCAMDRLAQVDLILVPGVAFDFQGHRLGRGKGFYDRLLASIRGSACGVAFDEQIVAEVAVEPHDRHVDALVTPSRWLEF